MSENDDQIITRFRQAEADFKVAHAKAMVAHRGEGDESLISSLALIDCETEYRAFCDALNGYDVWRAAREERVLESHDAAAEYHRSWATKKDEWAA